MAHKVLTVFLMVSMPFLQYPLTLLRRIHSTPAARAGVDPNRFPDKP
jgi:hypothetical protein